MDTAIKKDVEIYGELIKESRTFYYVSDWNGVQRGIPKSKVKAKTKQSKPGRYYIFTIPELFAAEKGFI